VSGSGKSAGKSTCVVKDPCAKRKCAGGQVRRTAAPSLLTCVLAVRTCVESAAAGPVHICIHMRTVALLAKRRTPACLTPSWCRACFPPPRLLAQVCLVKAPFVDASNQGKSSCKCESKCDADACPTGMKCKTVLARNNGAKACAAKCQG